MHQPIKTAKYIALLINTGLLLFTLLNNAHAGNRPGSLSENTGPIVVTIKPLYSLVAQLTEGIKKPVLLMQQMQSPHHYTMRPSERRLLADASMIVWTGPQMESYLDKIIRQQDAVIVTAIRAKGIKLLDRRTKSGHLHDSEHADADDLSIDPHIWLSTQNAIAISRHISEQLQLSDPANSTRYEKNLQKLEAGIDQLSAAIKKDLANNKQPFIAFHDAYQYFEEEHQLNHIDTISFDEETGVSLKHLRRIKNSMRSNDVQCLVYQPPKPDIIDSLADDKKIKTVAIDPLGLEIDDEKEAWFIIMRGISQNFKSCLKNR